MFMFFNGSEFYDKLIEIKFRFYRGDCCVREEAFLLILSVFTKKNMELKTNWP